MLRNLSIGLFASAMLVLGACSHGSHNASTETAATEGHQCSAECTDKNCKHDGKACDHKSCEKCKGKNTAAAGEKACDMHAGHDHKHGKGCGHKSVKHGDHSDFIHDGHQHHVHGDHVDEHKAAKAATTATETKS